VTLAEPRLAPMHRRRDRPLARAAIAGSVAALALALAAGSVAQASPRDPDSAETHARAKEALSRAQRYEIKGDTRNEINGETRKIVGVNLGVDAKTQDLSGLLKDLNAEVRGREVRIELSADVLFDFDKADLKPEAGPSLDKVVAVLKSFPKATATIEGHTDSKGEDAYNQKLSERRAQSVRKWLADNGAQLRMSTRGWGEKKPVAPNAKSDGKDDPEGRRKNRRVEITVTKE
jgi:outer membrane protein OmpA-like peptidoglycan-associated protein